MEMLLKRSKMLFDATCKSISENKTWSFHHHLLSFEKMEWKIQEELWYRFDSPFPNLSSLFTVVRLHKPWIWAFQWICIPFAWTHEAVADIQWSDWTEAWVRISSSFNQKMDWCSFKACFSPFLTNLSPLKTVLGSSSSLNCIESFRLGDVSATAITIQDP